MNGKAVKRNQDQEFLSQEYLYNQTINLYLAWWIWIYFSSHYFT